MRKLLSFFLHAFLLDAALSLINECLPISTLQTAVAAVAFLLALVLYAVAAFSRRLPARFVLPPVAFLAWTNIAGGFPLVLLAPAHHMLLLSIVQLLLGTWLWISHRRWSRTPPDPLARSFSGARLSLFAALGILAAPLMIASGAVQALGSYVEERSGGYFKLRPHGFELEERRFARDGREVRLVSMIHIGERGFYKSVQDSLPAHESAVVLLEGITDDKGLLTQRFSYSGLARALGLTSQESSTLQKHVRETSRRPEVAASAGEPQHLRYRHADIDVAEFNPATLAFMNALGTVLSSSSAAEAVKRMRENRAILGDSSAEEAVLGDILEKRNAHLIAEIDKAIATSRIVIVPWGALHLPAIETALVERGFHETQRSARTAVHFFGGHDTP